MRGGGSPPISHRPRSGVSRRGPRSASPDRQGGRLMSVDRSYIARNETERTRLRALVARLSDTDLARPLPAGWTVAGVLAHLAFWDQRALALLERDLPSTSAAAPGLRDEDVDWIN